MTPIHLARVATLILSLSSAAALPARAQEAPAVAAAKAAPGAARENLSRLAKKMIEIAEKDPDLQKGDVAKARAIVDREVMPLLDKPALARRVTGRAWRDATAAQRDRLTELVPRLIGKTYAKALLELKGATVDFGQAREADGRSRVAATVKANGAPPTQMVFFTYLGKAGEMLIDDVQIEGVSLIGAFTANFASVSAQKGVDGLIKDLEAKLS